MTVRRKGQPGMYDVEGMARPLLKRLWYGLDRSERSFLLSLMGRSMILVIDSRIAAQHGNGGA